MKSEPADTVLATETKRDQVDNQPGEFAGDRLVDLDGLTILAVASRPYASCPPNGSTTSRSSTSVE